ncbi:MAG TPA: mercuric transporter MerT family protein [Stellaceae bacterium]|jgi:mercuric ion transport protein|nr:mercuric transporter MerT family protein [Stellaceae bacterium]
MSDNPEPVARSAGPGDTGGLLLTAGGLAAAFGAAACCALPVVLGAVGLGGAWLATIAWVAAPHRGALLAIAIVCLLSGAVLPVLLRRRAAVCAPGTVCARPAVTLLTTGGLSLGTVLAVLAFVYA